MIHRLRGRLWLAALCVIALPGLPVLVPTASADAPAPKDFDVRHAAAAATSQPAPGEVRRVSVGIYVNQVKSIEMLADEYVVDAWVWFRFKSDKHKPEAEQYKPLENFEIIGGVIETRIADQMDELGNGDTYAAVRIIARIKKYFDVTRFPLDDHVLSIELEDTKNEEHLTRFEADTVNSQVDPGVRTPGWNLVGSRALVKRHTYTTNYGDSRLPPGKETHYSRFVFEMELKRPGLGYLFKLFWSIYLSVIIGFIALLIKPTDLDPRFGLGVGAIFAAAASSYVVTSAIPPTNLLTLSDKVNMISVGFIFLSLLESIFSLRFYYQERIEASRRLDRICFWGLMAGYGLANYIAVVTA